MVHRYNYSTVKKYRELKPSRWIIEFLCPIRFPGEYSIQTFGGGEPIVTATGDGLVFAFDDFFEMLEEDEFLKGDGRQSTSSGFESMPIWNLWWFWNWPRTTIGLPWMEDLTSPYLWRWHYRVTIVVVLNYAEFIDPITESNEPVDPIVEKVAVTLLNLKWKLTITR